ncbi:MAG: 2-amino-4-hydroxy-6-hydroxymethyldihydropteridine diphosphokinase [Bacteroidaceae bacterium]|nr:2-amino-4-hydroxy-6-hydroxymethyldihydropteridine diphosphokinase [Bacteroidaceae bacterium]
MKRLFLSLGSNLGDKKENLMRTIEKLSSALGTPAAVSSIIETEPWGFTSANSFFNCVAAFDTPLSPTEILHITQETEREMGRTAKSVNGEYKDRIIDIDILLYGDETINTENLTIPHPLMHKRLFVLEPLAQIAPRHLHPTLKKTIAELLNELRSCLNF